MKKYLLLLLAPLVLSGCTTPIPTVPEVPSVDVSQADCDTIESFRSQVGIELRAKMEAISDTYWAARRLFQDALNECMYDAWEGNPCDAEWEARTQAYEAAMSDISNEAAYQQYRTALAAWDACSADFDASYAKYADQARANEATCESQFQAALAQANTARATLTAEARAKYDADMAALTDLEERCAQAERDRLDQLIQDAQGAADIQTDRIRGGSTRHIYRSGSAVCQGVIPGETLEPRTGRPGEESVEEDIAEEILQQLAEGYTQAPIPTELINDRIFAGIVCAKLNTRLSELIIEQSDATRRREIELREVIERYSRAQEIWCRIAAGYTDAQGIRDAANALGGGNLSEQCSSGIDCGDDLCCSRREIGVWLCDEDGRCHTERRDCPENHSCTGRPGRCYPDPISIQAIFWSGHLIPLDQVYSETGPNCEELHWHANGAVATDMNGVPVPDPDQWGCGYGLANGIPVVEVLTRAPDPEL